MMSKSTRKAFIGQEAMGRECYYTQLLENYFRLLIKAGVYLYIDFPAIMIIFKFFTIFSL